LYNFLIGPMVYITLEFGTHIQKKKPVFATVYRQFRNFLRYRYERKETRH